VNSTIELDDPVDLAGVDGAELEFWALWEIENNFDYAQVEVSPDNGLTWIPQCGVHTNVGVFDQTGANGEPLYDGTSNGWVQERISLSDYIGQQILIRFLIRSDNFVEEDGFYFDDLVVNTLGGIISGIEDAEQLPTVSLIMPNPARDLAVINYTLPANAGSAYLRLLDMGGKEVRSIAVQAASGSARLSLNGIVDGVYMAIVETATGNSVPQRLVVVK